MELLKYITDFTLLNLKEVPDQNLGPTNGASMWTGGSLQTTVDIGGAGATSLQLSPSAIIRGEISGHKFNDQNNNGIWDAGEPPLSGWTIELYNDNGVVLATEVTDANGYYFFSVTPDADKSDAVNDPYYVREVEDQANWTRTKPLTNYYGPLIISADPNVGQTAYADLDFGNYYCIAPDLNNASLTVCENTPGGPLDGTFDLTDASMDLGIDGTMTVVYIGENIIPMADWSSYDAVDGTIVNVKAYYTEINDPTCFGQATITLNVDPRPVVSAEDLTECSTDEGGITAQFNLNSAVTYDIGTPAYFSGATEIGSPAVYVGADGEQITVTVTSDDDCETTKTFMLNVDPRPVVSVNNLTECSTEEGGNTAMFDLASAVTYDIGTPVFSSGGSIINPVMYEGTDGEEISVTVTSEDDCETTKTFMLNVDPRPVVSVNNLTECSTEEGENTAMFDLTSAVTFDIGTPAYFSGATEIGSPAMYVGADGEIQYDVCNIL